MLYVPRRYHPILQRIPQLRLLALFHPLATLFRPLAQHDFLRSRQHLCITVIKRSIAAVIGYMHPLIDQSWIDLTVAVFGHPVFEHAHKRAKEKYR